MQQEEKNPRQTNDRGYAPAFFLFEVFEALPHQSLEYTTQIDKRANRSAGRARDKSSLHTYSVRGLDNNVASVMSTKCLDSRAGRSAGILPAHAAKMGALRCPANSWTLALRSKNAPAE